ncbi:hypothetical protein [Natronomonas sp. EA1]|uniref:hypothetical protein n=1 Tax=Natronomonas sp. EA1 TaxID=3421655 RepID=UPI003EBEF00D
MAKFTLLELHLDGATFNAPFSRGTEDEDGSIEFAESEDSDGSTAAWKPALVGLLFLALIAVVVKKKLDGADEVDDDLGDLDDIDA